MPQIRHGCLQFKFGFFLSVPPVFVLLLLSSLSLPAGPVHAGPAVPPPPSGQVSSDQMLTYLQRTLQALEDLLNFFHGEVTRVNLDGVIGTRIVQGTLKVLLLNLKLRGQLSLLPAGLAENFKALEDLAKHVSDTAEPYVAHSQTKYDSHLLPLISDNMWRLDYPTRNLTEAPIWTIEDREIMQGGQSDHCLEEMFGTTRKTNETCVISDKCWKRMTYKGYHRYSLTHQIFYLQIGQLAGCMVDMLQKIRQSKGAQPGLLYLQNMFCVNILREAEDLANRSFPMNHRDLFMEQAVLCGMYGYWEFFRYSWLEAILSWQNKVEGCYNDKDWRRDLEERDTHRRKREEIQLNKHCLSHMSTVAASVLVQYVRYLTEVLLPERTLGHPNVAELRWS